MAPLQRFLARLSGYLPFDTFRSRAGVGLLLTAVFAIALMLTPLAQAGQATVTVTGTLTSGTDTDGTFITAGGSLNGQAYTLVYTIDDALIATTTVGTPPYISELVSTTTASPADASMTINGVKVKFSTHTNSPSYGPPAFSLSQNSAVPNTAIDLVWNYSYVGNAIGRAQAQIALRYNNPAYTPNYNWETNFSYLAATTTDGTISFQYVYGPNSAYTAYVYTAQGYISTYQVSGPVTITPPGNGVSAKNNGPQCCQKQETSQQTSMAYQVVSTKPTAMDADPINAATGNQTMHETDFTGPAHTQLSFTRYYNSYDQTSGPLGHGWHSTYHRGLSVVGSTATVTAADGRQDTFTLSGSTWTGDADVTSVLTAAGSNYKLTLPDDTVENYNSSGQLTSIVTRAGLTTTLTYTSGKLTTVTGPFSHTLTFTYDALNRVSTMKPSDGYTYTYSYDGFGNLAMVAYPTGYSRNYVYDNTTFQNLLTGLVDEDSNVYASWTYDGTGRALTSQHAGGADLTSIAYTTSTSSTVTDANGNAHSYALTTLFNVVKPTAVTGVPDPVAGGASFTYDANGFIASRTDFNGNVTNYVHNAAGEETSRTEAYGTALARTITTSWDATWHLPDHVYEPNRTTNFTYDASGNMLTRSVTDGTNTRTWTYTYNANGQPTSAQDALGNTTTWTYDANGDVATRVNALNQTTTFNTYDSDGHLISVTNPLNLTTTFTYDKLGRVLTKKTGGLTTTVTWDQGVNKPSEILLPDSSYLLYAYDGAHRLTKVTDKAGDYVAYGYDAASNRTSINVYDPSSNLKRTRTYAYDTAERLISETGAVLAETTTYSYDNNGNVLTVEDPNGHFMTYTYDALNRPATAEDPYSGITTNSYDAEDNLVSVTDPLNLTTTYTYNGIGDNLTVVSPDTGTTTTSYNAAGLVLTTTDARGKAASYQYDALNRTTTISYTGGQTVSYLYDTTTYGTGHLTKMTDPAGTTNWTYDQFGNVLTKSQTTGALSLTTTYAYDADERLSTIKYPSTKLVTYSYDTSGRISGISPGATSISYFPFGPASKWTENSGATYNRAFDQDGRITSIALVGTTTMNTQTITYDNAGNITALVETGTGTADSKAAYYDSFDRLTGFFNATNTTSYTYDADSNRTSTTVLGTTTTYTYPITSNRLTNLGGTTTYSYDASGNTNGDGTNTWTYDSRGRMATLVAGTTTAAFGINGFGQRITKSGSSVPSGGTNEFVYDEQGNMIGEYGSTGTMIEETAFLPDTPVSVLTKGFGIAGLGAPTPVAVFTGAAGATVSSVTADQLGAPHIITNASKQYLWTWNPYAFGDNAPNQNPAGLGVFNHDGRLPGQIKDAETNTNYNGFRDAYDPLTDRYHQFDPTGLRAGVNGYIYGNANPLTNVDPTGQQVSQAARVVIFVGLLAYIYEEGYRVYWMSKTGKVESDPDEPEPPTPDNGPKYCPAQPLWKLTLYLNTGYWVAVPYSENWGDGNASAKSGSYASPTQPADEGTPEVPELPPPPAPSRWAPNPLSPWNNR